MTDKPTPKEIDDLVYELRQAGKDDTYSLASAVFAKWGQPAQKTVTVVPATGDVWLKHDDDLRYVRRVLEAGRQMTDVDQRAAIDIVQGLRVTARSMAVDAKKPAQATEPVAWAFKYDDGTWHDPSTTEHSSGMRPLFAAPQPVAREPLTPEQIDRAIAELGLNYLADAHATNRAVLRKLCHHAHGIKGGQHG